MGADLLPRSILQQYDLRKDVWALLPPMPTPRYDANTHLLANKLYVTGIKTERGITETVSYVPSGTFTLFIVLNCSGGRHCKRPVKAFEVYDIEMRSWTTLPTMPCKRSYGGIIWDPDGRLCLLGGLRQGGGHQSSKFTKNVNIFDSNQGTKLRLSSHTQPPAPRTLLNLKLNLNLITLALRDGAAIMGISIRIRCFQWLVFLTKWSYAFI